MNLLLCFGTRPEEIKLRPLIKLLKQQQKITYKVLFTGQHTNLIDEAQCDYVFDYKLDLSNSANGSNRLNHIVSSILGSNFSEIMDGITHVLVQGDTTTAMTMALAAFHHNIRVIHLEAGLRTFDKSQPFPEEVNRKLISNIADIHFCPTEMNKLNLINEQVTGDIYVVGNTGLDNISHLKESVKLSKLILITLHRRENHLHIDKYFALFNKLALNYPDYKFILPLHPNPCVVKHKDLLTNVTVIDPLSHSKLIDLILECSLVISDSGGIQEECSFLNKRIIICRNHTERQEILGNGGYLANLDNLELLFTDLVGNPNLLKMKYASVFGDGNSSEKIINILTNL